MSTPPATAKEPVPPSTSKSGVKSAPQDVTSTTQDDTPEKAVDEKGFEAAYGNSISRRDLPEVRRTFACTCTSGLDQSDDKVAVSLQPLLLSTDPRPQPEVARYCLFVFPRSSAVKFGAKGLEQDIP